MKGMRWGDAKLKIHPAFPVLCAGLLLTGQGGGMGVMLLSLILHELGHVLAARGLGVRVTSIELMPFGGVARLEGWRQLPPWQAALISLSGPASNLLLAMCAIFCVYYNVCAAEDIATFVRCNLMLLLFNLLPVLPMDGGRLCAAAFGAWIGEQRALRVFSGLGVLLGACVLGIGAWALAEASINLTFWLTGSYLIYAALCERNTPAYTQLHRNMANRTHLQERGALPMRHWVVEAGLPVEKLAGKLSANCYHTFEVMDGGMRTVGRLDEGMRLRSLLDHPGATAGEAVNTKSVFNIEKPL